MKAFERALRGAVGLGLALVLTGCPGSNKVDPSPDPLDFGDVYVGQTATATATWTNNGAAAAAIAGVTAQAGPTFAVGGAFAGANLNPGASTPPISYTFSPSAAGAATGSSKLLVTGVKGAKLTLQGNGVYQKASPTLSCTGGSLTAGSPLDFGKVVVGQTKTLTFNVSNADPAKAVTLTARWIGAGTPFSVSAPPAPITAPKAGTVAVTISFTPAAVGTFTDIVEFVDGAGATNFAGTVVNGEGVQG